MVWQDFSPRVCPVTGCPFGGRNPGCKARAGARACGWKCPAPGAALRFQTSDAVIAASKTGHSGDFLEQGGGSGSAAVEAAFTICRPTVRILFALVDGAGQDRIMLRAGGVTVDLPGR